VRPTGAGLPFERVVDVAEVVKRLHVLHVGGVRGDGRHLARVEVTHRDTEHLTEAITDYIHTTGHHYKDIALIH